MTENPVTVSRIELGLSRRELCQVAGIRLDALYQIEAGVVNVPHRRVMDFLETVGRPKPAVLGAWRAYRAEVRQGVLDKVGAHSSEPKAR